MKWTIDETRWMLHHFDVDQQLDREGLTTILEVLKLQVYLVAALMILVIV